MVFHEDKCKPIIPNECRLAYVANTHIDPLIGHLHKYNLMQRISNFAHIKELDKIVTEVIQNCARFLQNRTLKKMTKNLL